MRAKDSAEVLLLKKFYNVIECRDIKAMLVSISEFLTPSTSQQDTKRLFFSVTEGDALRELLNITTPYYDERGPLHSRYAQAQDKKTSFFDKILGTILYHGTDTEIRQLLDLLRSNGMYAEIEKAFKRIDKATKVRVCIDFYLINHNDNKLLPLGGPLFCFMTDDESSDVLEELKLFNSKPCFCQFMQDVSLVEDKLNDKKRSQLHSLFQNILAQIELDYKKVAMPIPHISESYLNYGFHPRRTSLIPSTEIDQRTSLIPLMEIDQRIEILQNDQIVLTDSEVTSILNQEKNISQFSSMSEHDQGKLLDYHNALARRTQYLVRNGQQNPSRPPKLIEHLKILYNAASWSESDVTLFEDALKSPIALLKDIIFCKSASAFLAIFEQMAVLDSTKQMYFLRTPLESVKKFIGKDPISCVRRGKDKRIVYNNKRELEGPAVFVEYCAFLAQNMTKDQAKKLLTMLIKDTALHSCIPHLLSKRSNADTDLDGYVSVYLVTLLDPNADQKLKDILVPFGGVLAEKMTDIDLAKIIDMLMAGNRHDDIRVLLMSCREGGRKLSVPVALYLRDLFVDRAQKNVDLKKALFPDAFTHLSVTLMPIMTEREQLIILNDSDTVVSEKLVNELLPKEGTHVALSLECKCTLILRAVESSKKALDHLITVFSTEVNVITQMFTKCIHDKTSGTKLCNILLEEYFLRFLPLLIDGLAYDLKDTTPQLSDDQLLFLIEKIISEHSTKGLLAVVDELLNYMSHKDNAIKTKSARIIQKVLNSPALHKRLLSESVENNQHKIFTDLVAKLALARMELLTPLIDSMMVTKNCEQELFNLLQTVIGIVVINPANTSSSRSRIQRLDIINYILNHKLLSDSCRDKIIEESSTLIHRCCEGTQPEALRAFLSFGCQPSDKDLNDDNVNKNVGNVFHAAGLLGGLEIFKQLIPNPLLKRIPVALLDLVITNNQGLEVVDYLVTQGRLKDPGFLTNEGDRNRLFSLCGESILAIGSTKLLRFETFLYLVKQGFEPSLKNLNSAFDTYNTPDQSRKLFEVVNEHAPNAAILFAATIGNDVDTVEKLFDTHSVKGKLDQSTIRTLFQWSSSRSLGQTALGAKIAAMYVPEVDYRSEHSFAKGRITGEIIAQASRKKKAVILSLVGLLLPIISHIIILIWYMSRKVDVTKLQLDRADFLAYKNRENKKPAFDLENYEKTKPVQKDLGNGISCQRKLIELSSVDSAPVTVFFATTKQSEAFKKKVNDWAKVNDRQVKIKTC